GGCPRAAPRAPGGSPAPTEGCAAELRSRVLPPAGLLAIVPHRWPEPGEGAPRRRPGRAQTRMRFSQLGGGISRVRLPRDSPCRATVSATAGLLRITESA